MVQETGKAKKRNRDSKPDLKPLPALVVYAFTFDPLTGRGNMAGNIGDEQALALLQQLVFTKLKNLKPKEAVPSDESGESNPGRES